MKRGVFFDFDSTMTTPIKLPRFHRHAVADSPEIFASMTPQVFVLFGLDKETGDTDITIDGLDHDRQSWVDHAAHAAGIAGAVEWLWDVFSLASVTGGAHCGDSEHACMETVMSGIFCQKILLKVMRHFRDLRSPDFRRYAPHPRWDGQARMRLRCQCVKADGDSDDVVGDVDVLLVIMSRNLKLLLHALLARLRCVMFDGMREILANFGGRQRLARLGQVFEELTKMGCELFIVSIGFRDSCILPHLQAVGLEQHFKPENVFGQDSKALQERGFVKGRLIADLMSDPSRGWLPTEALFVDDSVRHTEAAAPYCEVVRVRGNGLSFLELDAVEALARGERKPLPGRVPWQLHEDEAVKALGGSAAMPGAWYVVQAESREPCSVFLLSTMSLGVGVFSLPTVWNEIGWLWGMGLCCYFGLLSTLLMLNLLDIVKHHNTESWEELCRFAPLARTCSRVSLLISLLIGNAAHMQTIAGMLFDILTFFITDDYGQYHFSNTQRAVLILIFLGVASPFCFADNLAALQHVGHSVALVVMLLCAAVVVTSCVTIGRGLGAHGEFATPATVPDFKAFLTSAPNVCFAFTGMLSFWEVFAALKKGAGVDEAFPRMKKTAICSGILVLSLYLLVSGFCIWTFGTEAGKQRKGNGFGNVLYNFPITDYPITLLCAALVVVIVLEYPIINFPMVNMILNVNRARMLIVILLDLAVPDLPDVFGLCGSLGLSLFCYVVPGYICIVAGRGLLGKIVGAFAVVTGLTMLFGGTFFILKRVVTGTE
ncbi:hypothetical protein AK812_SmicGene9514 [Symbiodinium microadriaticum]|uniref:Amino acid transporter transmembrane domain-containing protein n=1 Tax=Symbiodinium microadriaticum TaxID=2951 RepID=A0A1Q9EIC4_SYMMI|nr:hypothetical protein AK812_SmicGene9514 [Symbiodinium microadriaticum]